MRAFPHGRIGQAKQNVSVRRIKLRRRDLLLLEALERAPRPELAKKTGLPAALAESRGKVLSRSQRLEPPGWYPCCCQLPSPRRTGGAPAGRAGATEESRLRPDRTATYQGFETKPAKFHGLTRYATRLSGRPERGD